MSNRKQKTASFYKHAINVLRHGYTDPETNRRQGKFADGFDPGDGYDMRKMGDWTPAQKGKITRMFNTVDKLTSRPYQVYKSRDRKRLKKIQQAAQHDEFPKSLKVAFIPTSGQKERVKIKVTKRGNVKFKQGAIEREVIDWTQYDFTPKDLALNPLLVVQTVISQTPANRYKIQAGEHEVNQGTSIRGMGSSWGADRIGEAVSKMVNQYSADKFNPNDKNSSYYGNWLFGLVAYDFDQYEDYRKYQGEYNRARQATKDRNAALRRKVKRQAEKEKATKRKGGK